MKFNNLARSSLALSILLSCVSFSAHAGPFDKSSSIATIALGSGQFFREDYIILGAGIGYYIADGLEAGVDVDVWMGGDPSIYEVTPKVTYVYDNDSKFKPYLGVFYNRTLIEGLDDSDAMGYRAGVYMSAGRNMHVGLGVVNTELQDCTDSIFVDCSESRTEVSLTFSI